MINFDFIYNTGVNILELSQIIWGFFTHEIYITGFGIMTPIELMFGTGLVLYLGLVVVKKVVPFL